MPVDLSGQIYAAYEQALARAKLRFEKGQYPEAAVAYRQCADFLEKYARYSKSARLRAEWLRKAESYRRLAERLERGGFAISTVEGPPAVEDYESVISALVHRSAVTWDDIGGLEEVKREIKAAYGLALARKPEGVKLEGWRNILFYGPPGTGKTLLAAATSNGLDAIFFNVKVSDLLSKYFGESTRLISALYSVARHLAPSVVFLDEFEALGRPRGREGSGAETRIVSTFLAELDGLAQKKGEDYVLTIAATNLPWLIDKAVLSRFEKKIYIPLPDAPARRRIFEIHLKGKGHRTNVPYQELVARTDGYSGREIEQLCREAVKEMIGRLNPDLPEAVDRGREAVRKYRLKVGPLTRKDWQRAFSMVTPQTTRGELQRFEEWRKGVEGG